MMFALAGVEFEDFRMKVPTSTKDRNGYFISVIICLSGSSDASYLAEPKLEVDGIVMNRNVAILRKFAKEHSKQLFSCRRQEYSSRSSIPHFPRSRSGRCQNWTDFGHCPIPSQRIR